MAVVNALVILFAVAGLFFVASLLYGFLSTRKDKPSDEAVTVQKGYLTTARVNDEECPYVFSSPRRIYSESNSAIFMVMSAVLDGRNFPDLKVGETRLSFVQAINNSNYSVTPKYIRNLIIEKNGETMDIPQGLLPADLPKDIVLKVRDAMEWGPMDFAYQNRESSLTSFAVDASDFESFVNDITAVSLGYRDDAQDILLSESSFVSLDKVRFAECIKTSVLEWTDAIKAKVDSIQASTNQIKKA